MGYVRKIFNSLTMELSVENLEEELLGCGLLKYEWGFPSFLSECINGLKNFGMLNQFFF